MKNARTPKDTSAEVKGKFTPLTRREQRLLKALLSAPVTRKQADAICHASNGPDVVFKLRALGVAIETRRVTCRDFDGNASFYGVYQIGSADKAAVCQLLGGVAE